MPYVEVDVDLDEFYAALSKRDKKELAEQLEYEGYVLLSDAHEDVDNDKPSTIDIEWAQMITRINTARYQLTEEQEKMLVDLAKSL